MAGDVIYLKVAGGVQAHDLPLHWAIREQLDKGVIARANPDGSPWAEPDPEPEPDPDAVPVGTVAAVLGWVGDDRARAARALDAENAADKPRTTLVGALEALAAEPDPDE
jgi:hypothetical protein